MKTVLKITLRSLEILGFLSGILAISVYRFAKSLEKEAAEVEAGLYEN